MKKDIDYSATGVGDRYVLEEMVKRDAILGGEQSGHIILKNTIQLVMAINCFNVNESHEEKKQKLSTLADQMKIYPQTLRNVKVANKEEALNNVAFKKAIEETGKTLENRSRILVRPSGTEAHSHYGRR